MSAGRQLVLVMLCATDYPTDDRGEKQLAYERPTEVIVVDGCIRRRRRETGVYGGMLSMSPTTAAQPDICPFPTTTRPDRKVVSVLDSGTEGPGFKSQS